MKTKRIGFLISDTIYSDLKTHSEQESETVTHIITKAIKQYLYPIQSTSKYAVSSPYQGPIENATGFGTTLQTPTPMTEQQHSEEKSLADLIIENNKDDYFNPNQIEDIKRYLETLSDDELQELSSKLSDYRYETRITIEKQINDFFDWIKPPLSTSGENILDLCGIAFNQSEFNDVKEYLRTISEEQHKIINKKLSAYLSSGEDLIENFVDWATKQLT